jgi:hypothetical protein
MTFKEFALLPLNILGDLLRIVSFEGSWSLKPYERTLIEEAGKDLSPENREILSQQLDAFKWVARRKKGQVTYIHYKFMSDVPRMNLPPDYGLARMNVKSAGGSTWVSIGTDTGHVFFLQYKKPPRPIFAFPFTVEEIICGGKADQSVAEEFHNTEHGDDFPFGNLRQ